MNKIKLSLITVVVALGAQLITTSGAQADVTSCAFTGAMGPVTPPMRGVLPDLASTGADTLAGDPLSDTDNGIREPTAGWEDGVYRFQHGFSDISQCLAVDTTGPADDGSDDTGLYSADIDSNGAYDNTVCGTGLATDRGAPDSTTVDLTPIQALGPGEDIADADYRVTFAAGNGPIQISATTTGGETMFGGGVVHIRPMEPGNCVTRDVEAFSMIGAFTLAP